MATEASKPNSTPSDAVGDSFCVDLDLELTRLRARLADLDAERQHQLESEQRQRADRAAGREPEAPGIAE